MVFRYFIPTDSLCDVLQVLFAEDGAPFKSGSAEQCATLASLLKGEGKPRWPKVEAAAQTLLPDKQVGFRDDMLFIHKRAKPGASGEITIAFGRAEGGFSGLIRATDENPFPGLEQKLEQAGCTMEAAAATA